MPALETAIATQDQAQNLWRAIHSSLRAPNITFPRAVAVDPKVADVACRACAAIAVRRSGLLDPEVHLREGLDVEDRIEQVGRALVFFQWREHRRRRGGLIFRVVFFCSPSSPPLPRFTVPTPSTRGPPPSKKSRWMITNSGRKPRSWSSSVIVFQLRGPLGAGANTWPDR